MTPTCQGFPSRLSRCLMPTRPRRRRMDLQVDASTACFIGSPQHSLLNFLQNVRHADEPGQTAHATVDLCFATAERHHRLTSTPMLKKMAACQKRGLPSISMPQSHQHIWVVTCLLCALERALLEMSSSTALDMCHRWLP